MAQTAASSLDGKRQTLFSSVNHASTPYRIPAIATLNNGTVLAIADQRPCGADVGNGEVDIYAKVGTIAANGTYSWNPASIDPSADGGLKIADGTSSNGYGDAAVVVDRESGKVLVICVAGNQVFANGTSSKHNKMARIVGSADGLTWDAPQDVTYAFFKNLLPNAYTMFMASGKMVQSQIVKSGNYHRIYGAILVKESSSSKYNNYVVYSDDFGVSWKILGSKACITEGDEAKVEEMPNGDIVISSRTGGGRIYNVFNFTDVNKAEGDWSTQASYTFAGSNTCNGELILYKGLVDASGTEYNVVLQSLPTGTKKDGFLGIGATTGREKVSVYYKAFASNKSSWSVSDFTSGWTKGVEVDNGASAYSTMTILPNGEIGFLYEDDYDTSKATGDYSNIVYIPITASEITGGAYTTKAPASTPVDPTFTLSTTTAELTVGETLQLLLTNTSDGTVTYTSGKTAVATVDANGVVTAVAEGTATIKASVTATNKYNAAEATCTITVKAAAVEPDPEEPETPDTPELTTITVTAKSGKIGSSTYYVATFSHEKPMTVPSGVKAYYVKAAGSDEVTLTRVTSGKAIPAGQGVILISTSTGTFVMTESDGTNVADLTDNLLKATLNNGTMTFTANDYVLAVKGSGDWKGYFAFCKTAAGTVVENYANRAYLNLSNAEANIRMRFDDDATAIGSIENDADKTPVYYDLMGRRVDNPTKGIYIVNGKKVLVR